MPKGKGGQEGAQIAFSPDGQYLFLTVGDREIPKSTLSQHFKILREAGLIRSERKGVEIFNTSRCEEVDRYYPGLIRAIVGAHEIQVRADKRAKRKR